MGTILSLNRRHHNFDPDGIEEAISHNPDAVPLSYYEHGLPIRNGVKNNELGLSPGLPASTLLENRLWPVDSRSLIREWLSRTQTPRNRVAATESFAAYR